MADDRAGDKMGIKQYEQRKRPKWIDWSLAAHAIDQIGNQLEREKAYTDGQKERRLRQGNVESGLNTLQDKVQIFERPKRKQIEHDAGGQQAAAAGTFVKERHHPCH